MAKRPQPFDAPGLCNQRQGASGHGHAGPYHSGRVILQLHIEVVAHDLVDVHLQIISIVLCGSQRWYSVCKGSDPGVRLAQSPLTDATWHLAISIRTRRATCVVVEPAQHIAYQSICLGGAVWPAPALQASSSTFACCGLQGAVPLCNNMDGSNSCDLTHRPSLAAQWTRPETVGRNSHLIDGQLQRRPPAEDDGCALLEPLARRRRQAELRCCRSAPGRGCMQHAPS